VKRIKFTIVGSHPLLFEIRRHLIVDKFMELVGFYDNPDFAVIGASIESPDAENAISMLEQIALLNKDTPVLLLSSSNVYSDRDDMGGVSENKPMSEDRGSVISSPLDDRAPSTLHSLLIENTMLRSHNHVLVLRTFSVYGPETTGGTVWKYLGAAKAGGPLLIETPGYQTRTFLHMDDFLVAFDRLVPKFLKGARGIYNIGSPEEISLKRLADSIWQLTRPDGGATPIELVQPKGRQVWWVIPDITRIQVLLNWKPTITIRKGLWRLINEGQYEPNEQNMLVGGEEVA